MRGKPGGVGAMSSAANPRKPKKSEEETAAAAAARKQKEDRERIRRLIITVGDDKSKKMLSQIRGLAGALEDDVELHGELIGTTVLDCVKSLPLKTGIMASWVGRMAASRPEFTASFVDRAMEEFRTAIRTGRAVHAQLLLRFLAQVGNTGALPMNGVVALLEEVLSLSEGLKPSKGGDLGVFLALSALPFISPAAHGKVLEKVHGLLSAAEALLAARDARWKPLLRIRKGDLASDRLEALVKAVNSMKRGGWASQTVFHLPGLEPQLEGREGPGPKLAPLGITASELRKSKVRFHVPLAAFRVLTSKLELDGADDQITEHDRWVVEDYALTTIESFGRDAEECSKQLLGIPFMHPHFEAVVIEIIFSQMLRLPSPPLLPLFYSRLLQAILEKQASAKALVEQAYGALFEHVPDLDEECLETLAEAFAYHLMLHKYEADWAPFTGEGVADQVQRFIRRVLERLQRLSFHQNLLHRLPEAIHAYIPPEPVPGSGVPDHLKQGYERMLKMVRIKDPQEEKILKFCHRLMGVQPKEEQKEEGEGDTADVTVVKDFAVVEQKEEAREAEKPKDDDEEEMAEYGVDEEEAPPAKRQKMEDGVVADDATCNKEASVDTHEDGTDAGMESAQPLLKAKEEARQEDESGGLVTAVGSAAPGTPVKAKKEEEEVDEFGDLPEEPWAKDTVIELLVTALLQMGARTPTHTFKILDGHEQVLAKLRPADDEELHRCAKVIVRCVFNFWKLSGQRLEITLDALLVRGAVTSRAIVEHALEQRGPGASDSMPAWNMTNSVARKSLKRSQSVRAELEVAKKLGQAEVVEKCKKQLDEAIHETSELFKLIFTSLVRNHQDFEDKDLLLRHVTLQRVLMIGRRYGAFIKPLIDAADTSIPGVAHNPEIAAIFQSLRAL